MNLLFSYGAKEDHKFNDEGHAFLGAGTDANGGEVHVFLHKDKAFAPPTGKLSNDVEPDFGKVATAPVEKTFEHPDFDPNSDEVEASK
jgi:hypothetical protein